MVTTYDASVSFQFVTEPGPASASIRKWTGAPLRFSHVDAVVPLGPSIPELASCGGWLLGARHDRVGGAEPGVRVRPASYAAFSDREVVGVPCTRDQAAGFWRGLYGSLGERYATHDVWNFVLGRGTRPKAGTVCSVLQWLTAQENGVLPRVDGQNTWIIAPNPLYLLCRSARADRVPVDTAEREA